MFKKIVFEIHKLGNKNCMFDTKYFITLDMKYEEILLSILNNKSLAHYAKFDLIIKLIALKTNCSDELYQKFWSVEEKYSEQLNKILQ